MSNELIEIACTCLESGECSCDYSEIPCMCECECVNCEPTDFENVADGCSCEECTCGA